MLSCTSIPVMWNHGTTESITSAGVNPKKARISSQFAVILPWVSSAPFGAPVVPEVYWISAVSCCARGSGDCSRAGAATIAWNSSTPAARPPTDPASSSSKDGGSGRLGRSGR